MVRLAIGIVVAARLTRRYIVYKPCLRVPLLLLKMPISATSEVRIRNGSVLFNFSAMVLDGAISRMDVIAGFKKLRCADIYPVRFDCAFGRMLKCAPSSELCLVKLACWWGYQGLKKASWRILVPGARVAPGFAHCLAFHVADVINCIIIPLVPGPIAITATSKFNFKYRYIVMTCYRSRVFQAAVRL